ARAANGPVAGPLVCRVGGPRARGVEPKSSVPAVGPSVHPRRRGHRRGGAGPGPAGGRRTSRGAATGGRMGRPQTGAPGVGTGTVYGGGICPTVGADARPQWRRFGRTGGGTRAGDADRRNLALAVAGARRALAGGGFFGQPDGRVRETFHVHNRTPAGI